MISLAVFPYPCIEGLHIFTVYMGERGRMLLGTCVLCKTDNMTAAYAYV